MFAWTRVRKPVYWLWGVAFGKAPNALFSPVDLLGGSKKTRSPSTYYTGMDMKRSYAAIRALPRAMSIQLTLVRGHLVKRGDASCSS